MKNYVQNSYRGIRDSELTMKNVHAVPQLQCVQSEEDEGDVLGQGNERGHQDWGEWGEAGLRMHLKLIELMRGGSSALSFVCLSILPLLSCPGTLIKNTEFMVDELRLQQKTPGRHLYSELKPASFNYKAMQPNTLLNSHWNHPNWVTWVPSCRQAILEY